MKADSRQIYLIWFHRFVQKASCITYDGVLRVARKNETIQYQAGFTASCGIIGRARVV